MNARTLLASISLLALPALAARADDPAEPEPPLRLQLRLGGWLASAQGDLQTPKGGRPGSTSSERPTISEVGLDGLKVIPRIDLAVSLFEHELHLSYGLAMLRGEGHIQQALMSQGEAFAPGEAIDSSLDLQMIRLGYRARWLHLELGGWSFVPEVGLALSITRYTLESRSGGDGRVDRAYSFGSPYVGLLVKKTLLTGLDLELEVAGCALINGVTLVDAEARLVWTPWVVDDVAIGLELGLRGEWMRRLDGQPLEQNDPDVRLGAFSGDPLAGLTFGVRISF